ncbi:DUF4880 domain-containing protein [Pseudomonas sp. 22-AL-CL-001]|uniref:DUF4880 domain-containing protein n=1 Tax=Pseudomonas alabamensis TaxID=3064349 RepID=UPI002712A3FE|nr:DUF4880 domain-containing protein [Pseudomonas sp. 22-AL-CL-001]MDO7911410.1 DUF4880 domain-containing protein [Pseudomonas sp. 22-AL-CL-001]
MTRLLASLRPEPYTAAFSAEAACVHHFTHLPRRVQQVWLLGGLDGLDFRQIGERLGLSVQDVEHLMHQALRGTWPARDPATRCAGRWYVRLQSPLVTACERIDFRRWLDAHPDHLHAFHATELQWRSLTACAGQLGASGWYRHGRAALSISGCSLAIGLSLAAVLALGYWA